MLWIDPWCYVGWAVLLLLLPWNWLAAAAFAACIHEVFHALTILFLGGEIRGIRIGPFGATMEICGIEGPREVLCALAGPAGSFLLVLFIRRFPVLGLCGLAQGMFNLLPVYPLDGGRAVRYLLRNCRIGKRP